MSADYVLDIETILAPGEKPEEPNWCPARAEIVCIGVEALSGDFKSAFVVQKVGTAVQGPAVSYPSEGNLLLNFMPWFEQEVRLLVTFNGRGFDLPCLIHRAVALGVKPSRKLLAMAQEPRYKPYNHIDVRERFTFQGCFNKGTLEDFCLAYGLKNPKAGGDGSKVADLVARGDLEALVRYCLGDVAATKALWLRWLELTR